MGQLDQDNRGGYILKRKIKLRTFVRLYNDLYSASDLSTKNNPIYMREFISKKGAADGSLYLSEFFRSPYYGLYATFCMRSGFSIVNSVIRNMKGAIQARVCGNVTSVSARGGFSFGLAAHGDVTSRSIQSVLGLCCHVYSIVYVSTKMVDFVGGSLLHRRGIA